MQSSRCLNLAVTSASILMCKFLIVLHSEESLLFPKQMVVQIRLFQNLIALYPEWMNMQHITSKYSITTVSVSNILKSTSFPKQVVVQIRYYAVYV